jgi:hypothetical protein
MSNFWISCGHHLTDRDAVGLIVTDEFVKSCLDRPVLSPPPEACAIERYGLCGVAPRSVPAYFRRGERYNWGCRRLSGSANSEAGGGELSAVVPLVRIPIGVVVERRKAVSQWTDVIGRPIAVLGGLPDADPWTPLVTEEEATTFYAGAAEIELYRSETDNYRSNIASRALSIWVALHATDGEPPYEIAVVTADPAKGEGLTEPGQAIVDAVAMPDLVRDAIALFLAEHHVERAFEKRKRDRADPEALARRGPMRRNDDDR